MNTAATMQQKRVMEATLLMLALILLFLGIAGFQTLFKKNLSFIQHPISTLKTTEQLNKKNLLTYIVPDLKFSCSPIITPDDHSHNAWNGICRSVNAKSTKSYHLNIKSTLSPKKFKGFKLAKEVFYLITKNELSLPGQHTAMSISTFLLGGGTFIKISKSQKQSSTIYLMGFGVGLAFHIDKRMQIEFKEVIPTVASVN